MSVRKWETLSAFILCGNLEFRKASLTNRSSVLKVKDNGSYFDEALEKDVLGKGTVCY